MTIYSGDETSLSQVHKGIYLFFYMLQILQRSDDGLYMDRN